MNNPLDKKAEASAVEPHFDTPPHFKMTEERRMHLRALNYWRSLLKGRMFPSVTDLDSRQTTSFSDHSLLLEFSEGYERPWLRAIGRALREECGVPPGALDFRSVPEQSLIARLTDHFPEVMRTRQPVNFEAEHPSQAGCNALYRGVLMPLSSDGTEIDYIYGVINWKLLLDADVAMQLAMEAELAAGWSPPPRLPVEDFRDPVLFAGSSRFEAHLMHARASAKQMRQGDRRSRALLYEVLHHAYDVYLAGRDEKVALRATYERAGIRVQERAPMTAIIKLVFGADYDKARITEFAAVLMAAARADVASGGFRAYIDAMPGGMKALVARERKIRRQGAAGQQLPHEVRWR